MTIEVCKDCTERKLRCHSTCEKYLNAREKLERIKAEKLMSRDIDDYMIGAIKRNKARWHER